MRCLFFKAPWCSACHALEPVVPAWCEHVDCDKDQETAEKFHIAGLPVFIAVDDCNKEVARLTTTSIPVLTHWFEGLEEVPNG